MKNCFKGRKARRAGQLTGVEPERIKALVAQKLGDAGAAEEGRQIRMKKHILIAAAAAALCTGTIFAAQKLELADIFFEGKTDSVQQEVQNIEKTVENGDYRMTLEQVLNDDNKAFVVFSVEPLHEEAAKAMEGADYFAFDYNITLSPPEDYDWQSGWGVSGQDMEEYNQGKKKYYAWDVDFYNPEHKPLTLSLDKDHQISVPIESDLEQVRLEIGETVPVITYTYQSATEADGSTVDESVAQVEERTIEFINVSPLSVAVRFREETLDPHGYLYFELADGTYCGNAALAPYGNSAAENTVIYSFSEIMDLSDIRAVVVDGMAYPLDGSQAYPADLPETMAPFRTEPVVLEDVSPDDGVIFIPVQQVCQQLGAQYTQLPDGSVTVEYRGQTYTIRLGKNGLQPSGRILPPIYGVMQGDTFVASGALLDLLGVDLLMDGRKFGDDGVVDWGDCLIIP